ncbi:MAG: Crp/Fnr family transcriptional regulator [Rhodocyclaceae bacterium]|nr:Crp/Fnr family transcriptional regulator [Rhodocyclaceae bacterium]
MSLIFTLFRHEPYLVKLKAGDYLFREGDPSEEKMYVLVAGRADILVKHRVVEEAGAGTIIGEMGLIEPHVPRSASVLARTDCEFVEIGPKRFNFLVAEAPYFAIEVMRVLAERLRRTDQLIA